MIQKIVQIIMALVLMTSTMGFTVSKHYCGARLVDVSINKEAKSCCNDEGTCHCCHNETHHFQVENDYNMVADFHLNIPFVYVALILLLYSEVIEEEGDDFVEIADSPPPPPLGLRLSILQSYLN